MVKNVMELDKVLTERKAPLEEVNKLGLLNSEGVATLEAYRYILKVTPFYADLKEFYESSKVKEILALYGDCKEVKKLKAFLDRHAI